MDRDDRQRAKDDFWDIAKLLPQRRTGLSRFSGGPALAPVTDGGASAPAPRHAEEERRLTVSPPAAPEEQTVTYTPGENPLLLSVSVLRRVGGYSFYEQFRRDVHRFFEVEGAEAPYVPFFSFAPQYSQLSKEQRAYYFYLRSEVRAGRYPRADKGYFFLLVYEIITLGDRIPYPEGARLLAALWEEYRASLAGIDRYMIAYLTDYCLLYRLPCPELSGACLSAAAEGEFLEFFFGGAQESTEEGLLRLLRLSSSYSFEESRIVTDGTRALVTRHITGAMREVFPYLFGTGMIGRTEAPVTLRRRAFAGSLCSHNVQADITVTYISLCRAEGLRKTVGLAVKYAENRLRAALGVRARLSAQGLPAELSGAVDRYFARVATELAPKAPPSPPPAYERLYDAPAGALDTAAAARIENDSWELTRRLVVAEDEVAPLTLAPVAEPAAVAAVMPAAAPPAVPPAAPPPGALAEGEEETALLVEAYLRGGHAPLDAATRLGLTAAAAAERVNEAMLEVLGDVLLLPDGNSFSLIEDYREDAEQWLNRIRK